MSDAEHAELVERLERERPVPRAWFRGALARELAARPAPRRPRHLALLAGGCLGAGAGLLALAAALAA